MLDFGIAVDLAQANQSEYSCSRLDDIGSLGDLFHHLLTGLQPLYKLLYAPPLHIIFKEFTHKERADHLKEYIVSSFFLFQLQKYIKNVLHLVIYIGES